MAFDTGAFTQATSFFNSLNPKHEIITVNSLQQVKDFIMNKGDSYLLLDPNADLLYIKEVSTIGKMDIKIYKLTDVTNEFMDNATQVTISKSDYNKLLKRLEKLEKGGKNETDESEQPELDFGCK